MKLTRHHIDGERTLAVFIDFENIGIGLNLRRDRFEIGRVLERLVEKGKIVAKKAYADWSRFSNYTSMLHESAIELIEIPKRAMTGKNSADIRLCVDAMDLAYSKDHIDTFVIVSGDSDFSPLVSKLKELGKHVIGLGLAEATSDLLRDNCDEFIYYDDLDRVSAALPRMNSQVSEVKQKVFGLLIDSLLALRRENKEVLFSSMVKDTMKRKKPSFNEEYHGYRTFSELLEEAASLGLIEIEKHKTSGTYVVTRFGSEPRANQQSEQPTRPQALTGRLNQPAIAAPRPAQQPAPPPGSHAQAPTGHHNPSPVAPKPVPQQPPRSTQPPAPRRGPATPPLPNNDRRPPVAPKPAPKPVEPEPVDDHVLDSIEGRYLDD
ncbi:NYN domain-containing protein [Zavarzinella formosa]|uniref:NYN domain-containing protein n=1 Tax=Zavarzinella formosa TaxID=360055 RepID=UPI0002FA4719|nr:NYN domain-containing protein [Zavarzinella formosa]